MAVVAITGVSTGLGSQLAAQLDCDPEVDAILGIDVDGSPAAASSTDRLPAKVEVVRRGATDPYDDLFVDRRVEVAIHLGLGMAPGWSGTQRLVRRFGASVVRRMALAGAMVSAEEALALGLVDEVAARGEGVARAEALAADIAKRGPLAVQMVKAMINSAEGEDRDAPIEGLAGALTAFTEDLAEGVAAFRAKRPPAFSGR